MFAEIIGCCGHGFVADGYGDACGGDVREMGLGEGVGEVMAEAAGVSLVAEFEAAVVVWVEG